MHSEPRSRPFATLRFRLTFWNTLVILLLVGGAMISIRQALAFTLRTEQDHLLRDNAHEVALALERSGTDWPAIKDYLDRKARSHKDRAWFGRVFDFSNRVVAASSEAPRDESLVPRKLNKPYNSGATRRIQRMVNLPTGKRFTVEVGSSEEFVSEDVDQLTEMLLAVGAVVLLVVPLTGWWLAGRATRPIDDIIRTTERLRPDKLDERLPQRGTGDELDRLSETINASLDRIAAYLGRQREFVAHAAHELRSPLTALRAAVEVALQRERPAAEYQELLADLAEEAEALSALVNRLLLLAEGDSGALLPRDAVSDLGMIAARCVEMFQGIADQRGIALTAAIRSAPVPGDAGRLAQVVNNLLDNALKFTPAGGRVSLVVAVAGTEVVLTVEDSGPGIPLEVLPRVFDRFFTGDRSRSRGGAGLGLSICRTVVEACGGRIELSSKPGDGTQAIARLPLVEGANLKVSSGSAANLTKT
jgi:heavy metal sensor kinase